MTSKTFFLFCIELVKCWGKNTHRESHRGLYSSSACRAPIMGDYCHLCLCGIFVLGSPILREDYFWSTLCLCERCHPKKRILHKHRLQADGCPVCMWRYNTYVMLKMCAWYLSWIWHLFWLSYQNYFLCINRDCPPV